MMSRSDKLGVAGVAGGATRASFTSVPLIKLRKAPRQQAQRILSEFDTLSILRAAKPGRERILCEVGYYGALRVSEIASLTWSQVLPLPSGNTLPARPTLAQEGETKIYRERAVLL